MIGSLEELQHIYVSIQVCLSIAHKYAVAALAEDAIRTFGHKQILPAPFVEAFHELCCLFVVYLCIIYFFALVAFHFVGAVFVQQVGVAIPAERLAGVLASAFCADGNRAIGSLDEDWVQVLLVLVIIIEVATFLLLLFFKFIFEHAV